ncbi:MAG: hypothetical protein KF852_19960 [Saprospiraceae bacterium]|nr:hypothetical protein [Saprospiraceae bacterium]
MQFSINYNPAMLQYVSVGNFNLQGLAAEQFRGSRRRRNESRHDNALLDRPRPGRRDAG